MMEEVERFLNICCITLFLVCASALALNIYTIYSEGSIEIANLVITGLGTVASGAKVLSIIGDFIGAASVIRKGVVFLQKRTIKAKDKIECDACEFKIK